VAEAVALLTILALVGVGCIASYEKFEEISAVPAPPLSSSEVALYFDKPGLSASIQSTISTLNYGETEMRNQITIEDPGLDSATYFLVYTGDARTREPYPNGDPSQGTNGCWSSTWAVPDEDFHCRSGRVGLQSGYTRPEYRVDAQVLTGRISRQGTGGSMSVEIRTSNTDDFVTKAGKRRYFALPAIGTPYVPRSIRGRYADSLGAGEQGYNPQQLNVSIDNGDLAPSDRVENIAPDVASAGSLLWYETDASFVQASGSIVDTVIEERGQQALFVIATYTGLAFAVVPIVLSMVTKRFPAIFHRGRQRRLRSYALSVAALVLAVAVPQLVAYDRLSAIDDVALPDVATSGAGSVLALFVVLGVVAVAWKINTHRVSGGDK
jgi:hypothetical protein